MTTMPNRMSRGPRAAIVPLVLAAVLALALGSVNLGGSVRAEDGISLAATPVAAGGEQSGETSGAPTTQPSDSTDEPAAAQPSLSYRVATAPSCATSPAKPATAPFGDSLAYDCALDIRVEAALVDPANVTVSVTANVESGAGWLTQVSMSANADFGDAASHASATGTTNLGGLAEDSADGEWTFTLKQHFKILVRATSCGASTSAATISADATVTLNSQLDAVVTRNGDSPSAVTIAPSLPAPQPPTVSFNGGLDFGSVPVTTDGPEVSTRAGSVSLTVRGLNATCGDWRIVLHVTAGDDANSSVLAPASLRLVSVNGAPVANGGCSLDRDCVVDVVSSGPDASPTLVYQLRVTMTLPHEPVVGSFNATLTTKADAAN